MKEPPKCVMPKSDAPCLNCKDRVVGCHASCEKYKDFHERRMAMQKEIYNKTITEGIADVFRIECTQKKQHRKPPIR